MENMTFSGAIGNLKEGKKLQRKGWNGKGMFIFAVKVKMPHPFNHTDVIGDMPIDDCLCMKTAQNTIQPGWLASQADLLAKDWQTLE